MYNITKRSDWSKTYNFRLVFAHVTFHCNWTPEPHCPQYVDSWFQVTVTPRLNDLWTNTGLCNNYNIQHHSIIFQGSHHIGCIWREYGSCNLSSTNNVTVTILTIYIVIVTDFWIVYGWIISLAKTFQFLHCKTFSSDLAEYQICKANFYSTQQWTGPLCWLQKKCSGWRAALTRKPQGQTV
jgi:hypothetical protein